MIMKKTLLFMSLLCAVMFADAQAKVDTLWTKVLGGSNPEDVGYPYTLTYTKTAMTSDDQDNVFFVTNTFSTDGDVGKNYGGLDCWVVKLNSQGDTVWTVVIGGSAEDVGCGIAADNKGGCVVVGSTGSDDGMFTQTGHFGELNEVDGFAAFIDTYGKITKIKQYGGDKIMMNFDDGTSDYVGGEDALFNVIRTSDGNFMCVGCSNSYANDLGPYDDSQYWAGWFLKIDPNGKKISSKKISHEIDSVWKYLHFVYDVVETDKGDFIGLGEFYNWGPSFWVFRTDGLDNDSKVWSKLYSSNKYEVITAVAKKDKETYLATGWIKASSGDVSEAWHGGEADTWLFEIDAESGNQGNQRVFGGTGADIPKDLISLKNGNVLLAGYTTSTDDEAQGGNGATDFWLLELDKNLDTLRMQKFGGSGIDQLSGVSEAKDGTSFFLVGSTNSNDFFINKNKGYEDIWVGKIAADPTLDVQQIKNEQISIQCNPNPSSGIFNIQNAGGNSVTISDISGKIVYKKKILSNDEVVDIQKLTKGTYFLKLDKQSKTTKLIIN